MAVMLLTSQALVQILSHLCNSFCCPALPYTNGTAILPRKFARVGELDKTECLRPQILSFAVIQTILGQIVEIFVNN